MKTETSTTEWNDVSKGILPICDIPAFTEEEIEAEIQDHGESSGNWMESKIVLVLVNKTIENYKGIRNFKYITFGKMDDWKDWSIEEDMRCIDKDEEVTHWMPLPEFPKE